MGFDGVNLNKLNGGLGRSAPNTDRMFIGVIPIAVDDLPAGLVHYATHKLTQESDAEALGIDAAFDANTLLLHYNAVKEFYRLCPDGVVYIMAVPDTLTVTTLVADESFKAALRQVPEVKGMAIAIDADVTTQATNAPIAQGLITEFAAEKRLFDFIILPAKGTVSAMTIADYPDLRTKNAPNVSLSIAQDPAVAALDSAYAKYADWGAVLGMLAVRDISENLGSVNIKNKPDARKGDPDYSLSDNVNWLSANLSSGVAVNSLSATDKNTLTQKGYIYAGSYEGYPGVFFNDAPTSVSATSDYAFIENNCVWNKAARLIRTKLLPSVKGKVKKDPTTGFIRATSIADLAGKAESALETMVAADQISGYSIYIDPKQVVNDSSPLKIKATVVTDGIVHEFDVDLGLANNA